MPPALLTRDEVVARVMAVIRRQGYDGASLAALSKATGLGKSSLYHHFPDGKADMVSAVLDYLEDRLEADVFTPLRTNLAPATRLRRMSDALDDIYAQGREACLLASLGIGDSSQPFHPRVRTIFQHWLDAIATPVQDAGFPRSVARVRAREALVRIEGALVLARSFGDPTIFGQTLRSLPNLVLAR